VLVMSVNPGFGGQRFIPNALNKVSKLYMARAAKGLDYQIEIDGGVSPDTVTEIVQSGADVLVAGNAVYGSGKPQENVRNLLRMAQEATMQRV
jgi:ribulose-phosphate 3-epimerase